MTGFENIEHASLTDVGVRRSHNQDNHAIVLAGDSKNWQSRGHVFLVADGMGGHAVGELASELAVSIVPHIYGKYAQQGPVAALRKAFLEANASINTRGQQNPEFEGMGTTGTALVLRPDGAWIGHVGDSRAYRIRQDQIEQLTFDHSYVWEMARQWKMDPDEVEDIPNNVIMRSLGSLPLVEVDIEGPHPVQEGDIYVLCSDGLSNQITDHELGAVASVLPPAEACRFLVDLANLRGGPDNITVVIARVGAGAGGAAAPAKPRKPWHALVPWPILSLLGGTLLAAAGLWLAINQWTALGILGFLVAAGLVAAGVVGLLLQYKREQEKTEDESDRPPPRVYRSAPCKIERGLLDKLARAVQTLHQRAVEKGWDADMERFRQHREQAEAAQKQGDLITAFREYCRAMRPLTEALERHRQKEEVFQPVWDKAPSSSAGRGKGAG